MRRADDGLADCRGDGACPIQLSSGSDSLQNPAFSPDGSQILFTIWHGGYNQAPAGLYRGPAAGGGRTAIVDGDGASNVNLPGAAWSGARGLITFASDRDGADEIYTVRPDGSGLTRVTRHTSDATYIEPSFSPDGKRLVFEADIGTSSSEIWVVNSDGSDAKRLTSGSVDRQPNWSPAGDQLLFQRQQGSSWSLYTMAVDGSGVTRVTPVGADATDAAWSPRGDRIVYSGSTDDTPGANLFTIAAGGGTPVRVTRSSGYDGAPSWSPDGKWIAFESATSPGGEVPTSLWRIAAP